MQQIIVGILELVAISPIAGTIMYVIGTAGRNW
jgi:hypothetical protein